VIRILKGKPTGDDRALLEEAYRLRHRVFVEERGWTALARPDGLERDGWDEAGESVHFLNVEEGELTGYARLLPSDGLIPAIRTDAKAAAIAARPAGIRGVGRLCVGRSMRGGSKIVNPASHILIAMSQYALENRIPELFCETDPTFLVLLRILGFRVTFLEKPMDYYGKPMQLAVIEMSEASLETCRKRLALEGNALIQRFGTLLK
jgi:acyl-homoserine lactone synthase